MLVTEDGALRLEKHHWFLRDLIAQLVGMVGVIPADANDLHGSDSVVDKERHLNASVQSAAI